MKRKVNKIEYNKLIRDKIPEMIKETGKEAVIYEHPDDIDYNLELVKKIDEELNEYVETINKDREKSLIELADVYEVFKTLVDHDGFTMMEIEEQAKKTKKQRGGFTKRYYLISVDR